MADKAASSRVSRDVVDLLVSRGMTLTEIAKSLGVTKSYISRVKNGTRSLTLDHLAALEAKLGQSLPLLLLLAIPRDSVPQDDLQLYDATIDLLQRTDPAIRQAAAKRQSKRRTRPRRAA